MDEHQLKFGKALSDLKDNAAFHLRCMWRPRFWERAEEDPLSPLCVGYFMVSCNFTGMLCYVGKFDEDHVVVTEEWYGENPDKVNDEAEWRANAIGSLTRVVYASKEDEEIGGHFVPGMCCDLVESDTETEHNWWLETPEHRWDDGALYTEAEFIDWYGVCTRARAKWDEATREYRWVGGEPYTLQDCKVKYGWDFAEKWNEADKGAPWGLIDWEAAVRERAGLPDDGSESGGTGDGIVEVGHDGVLDAERQAYEEALDKLRSELAAGVDGAVVTWNNPVTGRRMAMV